MKLEAIFSEVFQIPASDVADDLRFDSIGSWDSLTHMILIGRLEESFAVQLSGDEIADMRTVGDARCSMRRHGAAV